MDTKDIKYLLEDELPLTKYCSLETKLLLSRLIKARKRVQELERENRLIPVGEGLPELGQWVTVVCSGCVQRQAAHLDMAIGVPKRWYWADRDADSAPLNVVTHWRPLPSPPSVSPDCKVYGMAQEGKNEG